MDKEILFKYAYWLENVTLELYHYHFFDSSKSIVVDHLYNIYTSTLDLKKILNNLDNSVAFRKYQQLEKSYFYCFTLL